MAELRNFRTVVQKCQNVTEKVKDPSDAENSVSVSYLSFSISRENLFRERNAFLLPEFPEIREREKGDSPICVSQRDKGRRSDLH
ncbi:hypothetical protein CEXT_675541 [Caerostris extrusa]|uniref:Uncharacterized protein n=1 Tax=Caerostris extrusa TaxID=172846 RepID=A0AAV4ST72_CAEEX|nr:hypothetical protein CEXT_675541 [Caerostris extrusa]